MRILFAHQGYPPSGQGGSERALEMLAQALRPRHDCAVLHAEADASRPEHAVRESETNGVATFALNNLHRRAPGFESYRDPFAARAAGEVVDAWRPDVLHVHGLHGLSTGVVFEARRRGIPVVITLHDFWPACPLGQLLNLDLEVCPGPTPRRCLGCVGGQVARPALPTREAIEKGEPAPGASFLAPLAGIAAHVLPWAPARIEDRLSEMRETLRAADLVLAPSRFLAGRLEALGFGPIAVVPYPRATLSVPPRSAAPDRVVRFGFLGLCVPSKGVHVLAEAFLRLDHPRARLEICGDFAPYHGIHADYRERVAALLAGMPGAAGALRGPLRHDDVSAWLARLDALVVPSIWEENAPLVVDEAFAARLPVIASGHGGLRERVRDGIDGLLFAPGRADALAAAMRRFIEEPGLRERLGREPRLAPELDAHGREMEARYDEARTRFARRAGRVGVVIVNRGRPDETRAAAESAADPELRPAVLVVENGPGPAWSPPAGVETLALAENRGFAAGANAGLARLVDAGCDRVLLLNNDARLEPGALRRLADALEDERVAAAGPWILRADGRLESRGLRLGHGSGRARLVGHGEAARPGEGRDPADALSGAALMIRASALAAVGPLDEDYFHSFEDADWSARARRAGFDLVVVRGARVRHASAATLGDSPLRLYYAARNHQRALDRLAPLVGPAAALRSLAMLIQDLAHAVRQREVPRLPGLRAVLEGFRDFRRGRFGPRTA
jgi:GT2 family glycosyltransferase/glycosyltransferase involved in cell wall biosynthesis